MSFILEDNDDYEIYFSHQCDSRTFNRGATKNIGFLAVKNKYPLDYKNINFIFNDVDTIPFTKIFKYDTQEGIVKHFYGFNYALGGIVVIKGSDFEKINGFPCYWGWGMEDNALQKRCDFFKLQIDRSTFYEIGSPQILQLFDGVSRIISKKDSWRMDKDNGVDGLKTTTKLEYNIDENSNNPNDNIFKVQNPRIFFVNILKFSTYINFENDTFFKYDLREPKQNILNPDKFSETKNVVVSTDNWTNIPHYPTNMERRKNLANNFIRMGKQVPEVLLRQIENDNKVEIDTDTFNNLSPNQPFRQQQFHRNRIPHKFSPGYANAVGQKPRAQASARIGLGGVF